MAYDLVIIGDLRFPGGTSTGIYQEIAASAAAGYRTGLINIRSNVLRQPHPINPGVRKLIDDGVADLLDPDEPVDAALAALHNPQILSEYPLKPLRVRADNNLMIAWHPPLNGRGQPNYDWRVVGRHAQDLLGGKVYWAPTGPLVREQFERIEDAPPIYDVTWHGVINPSEWRVERGRKMEPHPVIGRHSRPSPLKWPDTRELTLAAYPDDPEFVVRILGGAGFLEKLVESYPTNWQVLPFNGCSPRSFLGTIDYFVYFHRSDWVEAFGFVIVEALAAGAVSILPSHFEALFGEAAVYAEPAQVRKIVREFHEDPALYRSQSEASVSIVNQRFSYGAHERRLHDIIGPPRRSAVPVLRSVPKSRPVLFVTSNSVGLGHLTRLMAIARRCSSAIEPIFVTMSQAIGVVKEFGWVTEYIPFHVYLECDIDRWNHFLHKEIKEKLDFYGAQLVVFDGNVPYGGLIDTMEERPECLFVWCRRPMWRAGAGQSHIAREKAFSAIIEPREIAEDTDRGLTTTHRERIRVVDPILLVDRSEQLSRAEARRELGINEKETVVLIQLGSGNNFDYGEVRNVVLSRLLEMNVKVLTLVSPIAERNQEIPEAVHRVRLYPVSKYLRAFDFSVSAAGYNSYHELIGSQVPTIFIPNENPMMDDQLTRALYADSHGLGICLRVNRPYEIRRVLAKMMDPALRAEIRRRCGTRQFDNGAVEAARLIEEMVYSRRADMGIA